MELLRLPNKRSLFSEIIYIALNVALAVAVLGVVLAVESPYAAFLLILLSKWRVLAVRPRYWFANLQSNLVDLIVGLSIVVLLYAAGSVFAVQVIITILYIVWLLFIKPRSKRSFIAVQAGTATFMGVTALMMVSFGWPASLVIVLMWVIGYSAARHVLGSYEEAHISFYSLVWGLVFAELGWLLYHWSFAYALPGGGDIKLPQGALIALAVSFIAERAYASYEKHGSVHSNDMILPSLLSVSVILILLVFFNTVNVGAI
jgi:hypothetical protein